ncbi:hypothetical protein FDE76_01625 [Clostridium botulinum]|uniref:Phage replication initiation protein n=1 Tax=Clostridium botulinum (strain Eklund 17B / Type B) TaxID=935198 RepID=B2TME0_CLOBB|nr:phage replication initiation protein [Clostridium botulinum B str. Eklund 17B (NRP)]MBY6976794.1 hypothetical protein [Clostridium botulinum]MBY7002287.1 hypothetical protein [Clostridium botulinum]MCR1274110.1 replisome organizer [Clostridium botulinum]NFD68789.1 hypothetical protein [Clostridium botulinum]
MAEKRMFSKTIIDSDIFLDMPLSSQCLYFHLSMRADDDGFINNPRKIQRMIGCSNDDLNLLIAKKFLITFESGVVVIKHWRIHNYIQNDRYKETVYTEEKSQLYIEKNKSYTLDSTMDTKCIQYGNSLETQIRLEKISKDKTIYLDLKFIDAVIENVKITEEQYDKLKAKYGDSNLNKEILNLDNYIANGKGKKYKDHYRVLNTWLNNRKEEILNKKSTSTYEPMKSVFDK